MTRFIAALLAAALGAAMANAQITTGSLLGTITDASGALIPGVRVSATHVETNLLRETVTDSSGNYTLSNLPTGRYVLTASLASFQTYVREGLELQIQQRARVDIVMKVGDIAEKISVTSAAPLVNTEDATRGQVIHNQLVSELPLNGRNFNQLAIMAPGVQPGISGGSLQNLLAGGIAVWANGQRDTSNEWNLDGASMNLGFYSWNSFNPSVEAIQEFKMQTGMYSAEFGFQAGANVNIAVKSGTNSPHGSLFEFLRNDRLDARNFFASTRPSLRQNQFGGTLGGPVVIPKVYDGRNKTFFFFSYEGQRIRQQSLGRLVVPTPAMRAGDVSRTTTGAALATTIKDPLGGLPFTNNQIPTSRLTSQALNVLKYYPAENRPGQVFNYEILAGVPTDSDSYIAKVDQKLGASDTLFVRYARDKRNRPDAEYIPGFKRVTTLAAQNAVASFTHVFNPTTVNDFKVAFNRGVVTQTDPRDNTDFSIEKELGIKGIPAAGRTAGFPSFGIQGISGIGDNTSDPLYQPDEIRQFTNNLSMFRGKHSLKAGMDFRRIRSDRWQGVNVRGSFTFVDNNSVGSGNAFADFLLGMPQRTSLGYAPSQLRMRNNRIAAYFQDDWKVSSRLTVNLGLRYELNTVLSDTRGTVRGFDFTRAVPIDLAPGQGFYDPAHKQFAPRISFAYRPFAGQKTVIRAGYGIFYNATINLAMIRLASNPPFATAVDYLASPGAPAITFDNPFPSSAAGAPAATPNFSGVVSDFRSGYAQVRSFDIQQQLSESTVLEVGYLGSLTLGGDRINTPNVATPGPGAIQPRRPWPQYGSVFEIRSDAKTWYNGLTVRLERRFSKGLTFLSSYTFSRALDQSFSSVAGQPNDSVYPQDPRNLAAEKGLSGAHRKNRWMWSMVYDLPFGPGRSYLTSGLLSNIVGGWQVTGIGTFQSGEVFGVTVPGDSINIGGFVVRPNRLRDGNLPSSERSIAHWFDTGALVAPPPYTYGNAGKAFLIGPALFNVDAGLMKNFRISETVKVQYRAEFFNLPNHTNLGRPGSSVGTATFGVIGSALPARNIQMGLKLLY